ncbi:MFS transporter-like protein [Phaeosphaeriaceae sp. PMI808]|nr:MFS transporter-like protein [Phaeosphaeriaceae sp. PMI808]
MVTRIHDNEGSPLLNEATSPNNTENDAEIPVRSDSKGNDAFKIASAMFSFSALGLFNSSIGAALPIISRYYNLTDAHVSIIFLTGPLGYVFAAQFSNLVHFYFGQRGIAAIGPLFQIIATLIIALHPKSFAWVLVAFAVQGLGTGLLDPSYCAWAGSMEKANTISGLLHGSYSVGAASGPFFFTLTTAKHWPWYIWYYVLVVQGFLELLVLVLAFRNETASVYRHSKRSELTGRQLNSKAIFHYRATWLCAAYFLTYVGTETAISGWVVSFMLRNRNASPYLASLSSSGFWSGMAVGRLVLGFGTDRMGVRQATILYFSIAVALEALFAMLSSPLWSIMVMTSLGFIMGPLFPSGVVVLTRLLPAELHIAAVSFVASLGQVGGAFLPFAIGTIIQSLGIDIFRYAIPLQTVLALVVWVAFTRVRTPAPTPCIQAREDRLRGD